MKRFRRGIIWQRIHSGERGVHPALTLPPKEERGTRLSREYKEKRRGMRGLAEAILGAKPVIGEGGAWARIKAIRIAATGPMCEGCKAVMPDAGLVHLHHITPKAQGGRDIESNAALLCPNCHARAHWLYRQLEKIPGCLAELLEWLNAA